MDGARGEAITALAAISNTSEVLNVIYSRSSCWEEALKRVERLHFTQTNVLFPFKRTEKATVDGG